MNTCIKNIAVAALILFAGTAMAVTSTPRPAKIVQYTVGCVLLSCDAATDSITRYERVAALSAITGTTSAETTAQIQTIRRTPSEMSDLVRMMREALEQTRE